MTLPPGPLDRLAVESAALFVYGTLAFPEVMQVLLRRVPGSAEASAPGWRVAAVPGDAQAAMVSAEAIAHGRVISHLSNAEWRVMDAFDSGLCELRLLSLSDGRHAWSYVCADQRQVSGDDWDAEQFERDDFVDYLKSCAEWRDEYHARASGQ